MEGFFNDSELDDILVFRSDGTTRWVYDNLNDFHNGTGQPIGQWFFDNLDNPQNLYYSADSNPLKIIELTANRFIIEYEYDKTFWHPAKDDYYHGTYPTFSVRSGRSSCGSFSCPCRLLSSRISQQNRTSFYS